MIIYEPSEILTWLREISLRPCDFTTDEYDSDKTEGLAMGAIELIEGAYPGAAQHRQQKQTKVDLGGIVIDTAQDPFVAKLLGMADD